MYGILLSHLSLILLFTISFSTRFNDNEIQTSFLENEIVPLVSQLNFNDSCFLIYPSSENFKYYILPFLSSEKLLQIYFHFLNLYPNVSIKKFLPGSTVNTTVHDFPNSYSGYIFENEFSSFSPIIFNSEQIYKTVIMRRRHSNTEEEPIYGLFSSNEIVWLKPVVLSNNQEVCADFDDESQSFFVVTTAAVKVRGTIPQSWTIDIPSSDFFDCILDASQLNCFQKFYFKIWDWFFKYYKYIAEQFRIYCLPNYNDDANCFESNCFATVIIFVLRYIIDCLTYHAQMIPFYVLSFPFGYFLFHNTSNVVYFTIITKYFVYFWTIPSCLLLFGSFLYYELTFFSFFASRTKILVLFGVLDLIQIKPPEISWPVTYFISKKILKKYKAKVFFVKFLIFFVIFFTGFYNSLPLSYFMMIWGEGEE